MKHRQQIMSQIILAVVALIILLPVFGMLRLALDGAIVSAPTKFAWLPQEPTLSIFAEMWQRPSQSLSLLGLLQNSLLVSGAAALTAIAFGASMAFAFARFRFPGRDSGLVAILVGSFLPPVALMTPLYILLSSIGIRHTLLGLIVVYAAIAMPFCIWNMRAAFASISREVEESAQLDGASFLQTFFAISLPLAAPAIAVAALVAFLAGYTEFAIGWLFIEDSRSVTLAMSLWGLLSQLSWSEISALAILMSLPVVVLFVILQNTITDRFLVGLNQE